MLTDVPASARILREEIFGPVAPIVTFSTEEEAIRLANDTEYGLVAYAFTKDLNRGLRLAEELDVGMFGLNTGIVSNPAAPFGGVKQSGITPLTTSRSAQGTAPSNVVLGARPGCVQA